MRVGKMIPAIGDRKGFALLVAVGCLIVLVFLGAALQRAGYDEMSDVRLLEERSSARLATSSGLEAGLAELGEFVANSEPERSIEGSVGNSRYEVTMRKTTAGEVGPVLGWLPSDRPLVIFSITGTLDRVPEEGGETAGRPGFTHRSTAVVDPAGTPLQPLLWVNEKMQ